MEYPEKRRITWVDDETGELVGACDYYRHDLLEATQAEIERLRREVHVAKSAMVRNHRRAEKAEAERDDALAQVAKAIPPAPQPEAVEKAFRLIFEAYSMPADRFVQDSDYISFLQGKVTKAFSILRTFDAHPPQPSVSVACPAPTPDDETYYSKGKDANWLAALSDEDLAEAVCFAAQDLNDTGLGDDLDKWMPFQAMMCIAADRIKKLITAQPSVSDAQSALEAYGREKMREGMQRAADIANSFYQVGQIGADIRAAILAEMETLK